MKVLIGALAFALAATSAAVAGPPAPVPLPWSGFYAGGFVGGGGNVSNWNDIIGGYEDKTGPVISILGSGLQGGVNVGGNIQSGMIVFGGEASIGFGAIGGKGTCFGNYDGVSATCSATMNGFGSLAAKLGIAEGDNLFYLKGGLVEANFNYTVGDFKGFTGPDYPTQSAWRTGTLIGVGVDHQMAPDTVISGSIEFQNFGTYQQDFPSPTYPSGACGSCYNAPFSTNILNTAVVAKVGVEHKFN